MNGFFFLGVCRPIEGGKVGSMILRKKFIFLILIFGKKKGGAGSSYTPFSNPAHPLSYPLGVSHPFFHARTPSPHVAILPPPTPPGKIQVFPANEPNIFST